MKDMTQIINAIKEQQIKGLSFNELDDINTEEKEKLKNTRKLGKDQAPEL